ncbi:TOL1, partial [Symbiodinium microadriaticum]
MDFFGFSDAPELSTRIGVLVKSGTDPLLLGPDWAKNIEICDHINSHNNGADAVKAILHQLKSSDPKVVALALTMIETCTKNCVSVPQNINRSFMDEMVNISTGRKGFDNQEDALKMIQMWGLSYERRRNELPLFFETYMTLKTRGIRFPEPEDQPTSPQSRGNSDSACAHPLSRSVDMAAGNQSDDSTKLRNDLGVVMEKIRLCREMLPESPGIQQDEILAEVVGFLEACQERMIDLIETGTQGLLAEDVFELCLRVNDALLRTLEAEK